MSTGIVLIIDEQKRGAHLADHIENEGRFTDALSTADWGMNERSIALIGLDSRHLHYAALARRGRRVATLKFHVEFTDFVDLQEIGLDELEGDLRSALRSHFFRITSGSGHPVPQQTWLGTLAAIRHLRPEISSELDRLELLASSRQQPPLTPRLAQLAQEKDALLLARQIFDLDPKRDPLRWAGHAVDASIPSFLAGVDADNVQEDSLIQHDRDVFGLWRLIWRNSVGAVQFARGDERLTVITANRNKLERTLGVDLIYWHHQYRAFIMVQYKRMVKEGLNRKKAVYRPSGSYADELRRMQSVWQNVRRTHRDDSLPLCSDFRLSENPFFFKLCHLAEFDPGSQGLVPGMYIPLDYWDILLASDRITGPRGGKAISYENAGRHLNNTEFISLVQRGWIGSCGLASARLEDLVEQALNGGRAVELAVSHALSTKSRKKSKFRAR